MQCCVWSFLKRFCVCFCSPRDSSPQPPPMIPPGGPLQVVALAPLISIWCPHHKNFYIPSTDFHDNHNMTHMPASCCPQSALLHNNAEFFCEWMESFEALPCHILDQVQTLEMARVLYKLGARCHTRGELFHFIVAFQLEKYMLSRWIEGTGFERVYIFRKFRRIIVDIYRNHTAQNTNVWQDNIIQDFFVEQLLPYYKNLVFVSSCCLFPATIIDLIMDHEPNQWTSNLVYVSFIFGLFLK